MPFRLLVAAFAAALLATLGLMFARVASAPAGLVSASEGDILLLRHLALGFFGGLALQVYLLYRPFSGIYRCMAWGVAGFLAFTLMPWLVLPDTVPGQVTSHHPLRWLIVAVCTAGGLWLLWSPGNREKARRHRRIAGLGLLILPLMAGAVGGDGHGPPGSGAFETVDAVADPETGPDFGVWRGLALNLLFWLLLGVFSVLMARRVVQRPQGMDDGESGPAGGPGSGPGTP
jgi:predicted cobalt transporter CbtA